MNQEKSTNELRTDEKECEKVRKAVSRYGVHVVCNEDEEAEESAPDLVLPAGGGCESVKKVASKIGYQVVCEEKDCL